MTFGRWGWMIVGLACLSAGGCEDDGATPCQPSGEGRIAGVVRTGGVSFDARVRAIRITGVPGNASSFEGSVGADGSYAVDVPAGRYVIGLITEYTSDMTYEYSAEGLRFGDAPPDTLQVDAQNSPVAIDFDLAGLRAQVELPSQLDGSQGYIILHRRGPVSMNQNRSYVRSTGGDIQGGALDVALGAVLPGSYKVEVTFGSYLNRTSFWIPGVRDSAQSPWIEVGVDSAPLVTARLATEPARIQGRILGAWLEFGTYPPSLLIFASDSSLVLDDTSVGPDGTFDRTLFFAPAAVKLRVEQEGIHQWIGGENFAAATAFELAPGRTVAGIEFIQCGMFGVVSLPFPYFRDAKFELYDAATLSLAATWYGRYNSDLVFAIPNLRPGNYLMQIQSSSPGQTPWAPQWHDRVIDPALARTITIGQPGEIARLAVVLEKGGTIAGVVREVPSVTTGHFIFLTPADERTRWSSLYASSQTRTFQFLGLPDGDWKVGAWRYSEINQEPLPTDTVWYPGTMDWHAARIISTHGFEDLTGIEIVMPVSP